jgi:hypothetical protein
MRNALMAKSEKKVYRGSYLTGHRGPPGPAPPMPTSGVLQSCVPPPPKPKDVTVKIIVR